MRLNLQSLSSLPATVERPNAAVTSAGVGIVHLGIGAFHRAHQAVYTDDAMALSGGDWGICGVSLKSPTVRDQLAPQDGLYSVRTVSRAGDAWRAVGASMSAALLSGAVA